MIASLSRQYNFTHHSSPRYNHRLWTVRAEEEFAKVFHDQVSNDLPFVYDRHFYFVDFTSYGFSREEAPVYFNLVRDPIERFVSAFHYRRSPKRWKDKQDTPPQVNEVIAFKHPCHLWLWKYKELLFYFRDENWDSNDQYFQVGYVTAVFARQKPFHMFFFLQSLGSPEIFPPAWWKTTQSASFSLVIRRPICWFPSSVAQRQSVNWSIRSVPWIEPRETWRLLSLSWGQQIEWRWRSKSWRTRYLCEPFFLIVVKAIKVR